MIIDVHTHLTAKAIGTRIEMPEKTPFPVYAYAALDAVNGIGNLEYMDAAGIDKAVLLPLPIPPGTTVPPILTNEAMLKTVALHPDRFIPFGTFDPRQPGISYRDEMQRLVDSGCLGFGEWKPNPPEDSLRVDDPRAQELYGLCAEARLPVLLHLDGNINRDIDGFERMVAQYADTIFIAHGPSWWAEMAADRPEGVAYPTGPIERPGRADAMLGRYPNLYADISAGSGLRGMSRDPGYTKGFVQRHWRRLILGTDFPCINGATGRLFGVDRSHLDLVLGLEAPEEQRRAILSDNLLRILRPA